MEKTVLIIKPDGVARGLIGEILQRYERVGLKLVAMEMLRVTEDMAGEHYPSDKDWLKKVGERSLREYQEKGIDPKKELGTDDPLKIGKMIKQWNVDYLTEGPVLAMVFEGYDAIATVRKITGATNPREALPGTVRGDYTSDNVELANSRFRPFRNLVHASGSPEEAKNELELWFDPKEIMDYKRSDEEVMYK